MQVYKQDFSQWKSFLTSLKKGYEVIAPVKEEVIRFKTIDHPDEIHLDKNSFFPIKEYFFKQSQVLFQFKGLSITVPTQPKPKRVFFGIRHCDLNAIRHQDMVFMEDSHDPYYKASREHSYLLGYHCDEAPSPYCFCGSLDLVQFHDLMYYKKKNHFLVEVGSDKGQMLINSHSSLFQQTAIKISQDEKKIKNADRLHNPDISKIYDNPQWKEGVDLCLSCSACTALCPTCYCFDIHDEVKMADPTAGERKRQWSSCQVQEFSRTAGNHVFRKEREHRFKHRIYHQLDYFKEKYGVNMCVGCGRCIEGCPTRIDFVDIINKMGK